MRATMRDGINLHVEVTGAGPALLFVHGYPISGRMWDEAAARLSGEFRCIVPDLRGFGRSEATAHASIEMYSDDLAAVLDGAEVRGSVPVIGLSMGGIIAMEFFRRHRARVSALVLVDTRALPETPEGRVRREEIAQTVERENSARAAVEALRDKILSPAAPEAMKRRWMEEMMKSPPAGVAAGARALAGRPDLRPLLPRIDVPTLVVVGEDDQITPPSLMREMHEAIPGSRFVVIPGAGHLTPVEKPGEFVDALRGFIVGMRT